MSSVDYDLLQSQLHGLLDGETDALAATSNFVALLFTAIDDVNWLGVYVLRGDELVLGPFQGKPACVHIPVGNGVCGVAAATGITQRVADVHEFPGHIVCDAHSRSELVVPLIERRRILAVSFTSRKFSGRAPAGNVLLRTFVGGAMQPELLERTDEELVALVQDELQDMLAIDGPPEFAQVFRHCRAIP